MRETNIPWKKIVETAKKYQYALLILAVGLVLLVWPAGAGTPHDAEAVSSAEGAETFDLRAMETRLAESLSKIDGVGQAEVVLTLAAGSERILASDQEMTEESHQRTTVVLHNGSSQETTVTTQIIYPTFQGALIICDGGRDPTVALNVLKAVEALTGLRADEISVCARTGGTA